MVGRADVMFLGLREVVFARRCERWINRGRVREGTGRLAGHGHRKAVTYLHCLGRTRLASAVCAATVSQGSSQGNAGRHRSRFLTKLPVQPYVKPHPP